MPNDNFLSRCKKHTLNDLPLVKERSRDVAKSVTALKGIIAIWTESSVFSVSLIIRNSNILFRFSPGLRGPGAERPARRVPYQLHRLPGPDERRAEPRLRGEHARGPHGDGRAQRGGQAQKYMGVQGELMRDEMSLIWST